MNKELCNKIEAYLVQDVEKIEGTGIYLKNGKKGYPFQTDDFSVTVKQSDSDSGLLYNVEETVVIDSPTEEIRRVFRANRSVILRLCSSDGVFLIGTKTIPAQIILTGQLNKSQLSFKCSCLSSPF